MAFAYDIYTTTSINKVVLGGTLTKFRLDEDKKPRCRAGREKGERPSLACGMRSLFQQARPFVAMAWKPH